MCIKDNLHGTNQKCPDYQDFLDQLHANRYFKTITKCPDYRRAELGMVCVEVIILPNTQ